MSRVLERFFGPRRLADIRYDPYLQKLSYKIVEHESAKEMNWAILDFAALICRPQNPRCMNCFLSHLCHYFLNGKK
jgi:A/G-specific adenine glycosylase